jgi:hypothetical protein
MRRTSETAENVADLHSEFLSEDFDTSAIDMDDIRREIEQLSRTKPKDGGSGKDYTAVPFIMDIRVCPLDFDESEWDKGLTDDLENVSAEELEAQIQQMLKGDTK